MSELRQNHCTLNPEKTYQNEAQLSHILSQLFTGVGVDVYQDYHHSMKSTESTVTSVMTNFQNGFHTTYSKSPPSIKGITAAKFNPISKTQYAKYSNKI